MHPIAVTSRPVALLSQAHNVSWQPFCAASHTPAKSKLTCNNEARLCLELPCDSQQQTKRRLQGNCKVCRAQSNENSADHIQSASSQRITNLLKAHQVAPQSSVALVHFDSSSLERTIIPCITCLTFSHLGCSSCPLSFIHVVIHLSIAGSDTPACGCKLGQSRRSFLVASTRVKPLHTG